MRPRQAGWPSAHSCGCPGTRGAPAALHTPAPTARLVATQQRQARRLAIRQRRRGRRCRRPSKHEALQLDAGRGAAHVRRQAGQRRRHAAAAAAGAAALAAACRRGKGAGGRRGAWRVALQAAREHQAGAIQRQLQRGAQPAGAAGGPAHLWGRWGGWNSGLGMQGAPTPAVLSVAAAGGAARHQSSARRLRCQPLSDA